MKREVIKSEDSKNKIKDAMSGKKTVTVEDIAKAMEANGLRKMFGKEEETMRRSLLSQGGNIQKTGTVKNSTSSRQGMAAFPSP